VYPKRFRGGHTVRSNPEGGENTMPKVGYSIRTIVALAVAAVLAAVAAGGAAAGPSKHSGTTLVGAGSSFVAPLVAQWIPAVGGAFGYELQYSAIGSGGGINAITNRTVDFGASDAPLSSDQFNNCKGCVQIPWALSATSVIYNLNGVQNLLHMDGDTLAKIFLGQITSWDDPAIKALNPKVTLPSQKIAIVHRSDNSGTTYNFTDYLASVSPTWKSQLGTGVAVAWPAGTGASGSAGVAAGVSQTPGGIGYVDVAYAKKNHLKFLAMKNASGKFTTPGLRGIIAAASSDQKPDPTTNQLSIVNPPKKFDLAYPISTYTYVIVPTQSTKAADLKKFLFWAVTKGQSFGPKLLFQPIPTSVLVVAEKTIAKIHS
jgi:phosphate transport system substrate-binding protein